MAHRKARGNLGFHCHPPERRIRGRESPLPLFMDIWHDIPRLDPPNHLPVRAKTRSSLSPRSSDPYFIAQGARASHVSIQAE